MNHSQDLCFPLNKLNIIPEVEYYVTSLEVSEGDPEESSTREVIACLILKETISAQLSQRSENLRHGLDSDKIYSAESHGFTCAEI